MRFLCRLTTAATIVILALNVALPARAQSGEEVAVARAVDAFRQALLSIDRAQLQVLLAPELSYGHSAGQVQNRQEFIDTALSGPFKPRSIELSDRHVTVFADDAIVRHNFTAEAVNSAGETKLIRIGMMEVWQKRGGNW